MSAGNSIAVAKKRFDGLVFQFPVGHPIVLPFKLVIRG
jgi:hypothetical protein